MTKPHDNIKMEVNFDHTHFTIFPELLDLHRAFNNTFESCHCIPEDCYRNDQWIAKTLMEDHQLTNITTRAHYQFWRPLIPAKFTMPLIKRTLLTCKMTIALLN